MFSLYVIKQKHFDDDQILKKLTCGKDISKAMNVVLIWHTVLYKA